MAAEACAKIIICSEKTQGELNALDSLLAFLGDADDSDGRIAACLDAALNEVTEAVGLLKAQAVTRKRPDATPPPLG